MKVLRKIKIDTDEFIVGDQINVGYYTATCQKVEADGYIFLLDQYLDEPMWMNKDDTNEGGYEKSNLRKRLNSTEILDIFVFGDVSNMLVPFEDGALFRLPFYGEMFGHDGWYRSSGIEPDDYEQWILMKDRKNRIAERTGDSYEWGWLQNKDLVSSTDFCGINTRGKANCWNASARIGVRPVFKFGKKRLRG